MDAKECFGLLRYCLGNKAEGAEPELERISMADWDRIIQLAGSHDVASLLYSRLKERGRIAAVPSTFARRLQEMYFHTAAKNMRLYSDFSEVCNALARRGIDVVALKGLHLADVVYGDIALRHMNDMDLLVRRKDLLLTQDELLKMGYESETGAATGEQWLSRHHLAPFTKRAAPPIEIHWSITPPNSPFRIDMDELWDRARRATIAGAPILLLSPEDLLLHLCLHVSFNHKFTLAALRNACDIHETISYYRHDIEWERVISTAANRKADTYVYCTLSLVRGLLGTEMPAPICDKMRDRGSEKALVEALVSRVLFPDPLVRFLAASLSSPPVLSRMGKAATSAGKIMIAFRSLFPTMRRLREKYRLRRSSKTVYLYILVHFLDVFTRSLLLLIPERSKERLAKLLFRDGADSPVMRKWCGF